MVVYSYDTANISTPWIQTKIYYDEYELQFKALLKQDEFSSYTKWNLSKQLQ